MRIPFIVRCFPFLLVMVVPTLAQLRVAPPPAARMNGTAMTANEDESRDRMISDMAKRANLQRQALIRTDTERLLKLAEELKEDVQKTNENMLSLDVLKKAEEIEKLAHTVKDKMKGTN
jgi:hypothetical protein